MESITNIFDRAGTYLTTIGVADFIDIIIVAFLIYRAIAIVRKSSFINLAKGLLLFLVALWLSEIFGLIMIHFFLRRAVELGVIALVIIFQPEARRVLERVGSRLTTHRGRTAGVMELCIEETVKACADMSASRTGALIVFERAVSLASVCETGTYIKADTSAELLENLFFKNTPLHDGAVVIREGRIEAAGCILPRTKRKNISKDLGMRHRAAMGQAEESDALVVVVSEETGAISIALEESPTYMEGLKRHLSKDELQKIRTDNLIPKEKPEKRTGIKYWLKGFFTENGADNENKDQKTV